jgi:hypothetical protein
MCNATILPQTHGCEHMNRLVKFGVVLAGYVTSVLAACAAVDFRQLHTQGEHVQASAGMYAFGDALLFLVVFGVRRFSRLAWHSTFCGLSAGRNPNEYDY